LFRASAIGTPPSRWKGSSVISELVTTLIGLVLGLLTGFFFERRATKSAKAQNTELRHQLEVLKATVYSLGGDPASRVADPLPTDLLCGVTGQGALHAGCEWTG